MNGRLTHLVELENGKSTDDGRGRNERGDDFSGDLLRLVLVGSGDAVVGRPQVGGSVDEVDVEVGVVVLLEVDRGKSVASERRRRRERLDDLGSTGRIWTSRKKKVEQSSVLIRIARLIERFTFLVVGNRLSVVDLDLDTLLGNKGGNLDGLENLLEDGGVALALEAVVESVKVGGGNDVLEVSGLRIQSIACQPLVNRTARV